MKLRDVHACDLPPLLPSSQGFDEYMNLVLDDAEEVNKKKGTRKTVGEYFLSVEARQQKNKTKKPLFSPFLFS